MKKPSRLCSLLVATVIGFALGVLTTLGATAPAQSSHLTKANLDAACVLANGNQHQATLVQHNVLGWRCTNTLDGRVANIVQKDVDVQLYCDTTHPGSKAKWQVFDDPLGWYCGAP